MHHLFSLRPTVRRLKSVNRVTMVHLRLEKGEPGQLKEVRPRAFPEGFAVETRPRSSDKPSLPYASERKRERKEGKKERHNAM